jgi:amidase
MLLTDDPCRAFLPYPAAAVAGARTGPLAGLTLAVKDLYDVKGYPTGVGSPHLLALSGVKRTTAPVVTQLLKAGARFVGKTICDELCFSMTGQNVHFGTPLNPAAPDRVPGGSSSGSASAVAGRLADIGLGSDTGGSVRAPASYCGLFGIRPTHGALSLAGAWPLAPSFDTAGWFARDAATFGKVADVLFGPLAKATPRPRWLIAADALALAEPATERALRAAIGRAAQRLGEMAEVEIVGDAEANFQAFRTIQAWEGWQSDGALITRYAMPLGPPVRDRFAFGATLKKAGLKPHAAHLKAVRARLDKLLGKDGVVLLPTVPGPAPRLSDDEAALNDYRLRAQKLLCLSGLSGLPQVTIPATLVDGAPVGLSLLGPRSSDRWLIELAAKVADAVRLRMAG